MPDEIFLNVDQLARLYFTNRHRINYVLTSRNIHCDKVVGSRRLFGETAIERVRRAIFPTDDWLAKQVDLKAFLRKEELEEQIDLALTSADFLRGKGDLIGAAKHTIEADKLRTEHTREYLMGPLREQLNDPDLTAEEKKKLQANIDKWESRHPPIRREK